MHLTITLTGQDITNCIRAYLESQGYQIKENISLNASPAHDAMDRPMGTYDVTATVRVEKP